VNEGVIQKTELIVNPYFDANRWASVSASTPLLNVTK